MVFGTARELLRERGQTINEREQLRFDKLKLELELAAANREIEARDREIERLKKELTHAIQEAAQFGVVIRDSRVDVKGDMAGGDKVMRENRTQGDS